MLSDKPAFLQGKKRRLHNSIEHKMSTTFFVLIMLFSVFVVLIHVLFLNWLGYPGIAIVTGITVIFSYVLAKKTAMLFSFKFIDQVNNITGTAKAISNSHDLSRRVNMSQCPDELSQLESALNEMLEQMELAFKLQKRFIADASHELRTPITILNAYLDILEWGKNDPVLMEEAIIEMKEEIRNMKKLSENLLLLSKLEIEQRNLEWDTVDLAELLDKLLKDTTIIAGNREVKCKRVQSLCIQGDYFLLLQMLRAVVENSIKYTAEDGRIEILLEQKNNCAIIEISDDGIGIPEQDVNRIFERFYRVDKGHDQAKGGTGLGLSLVKQISRLHGGDVKVSSVVGRGTTVRFTLPP